MNPEGGLIHEIPHRIRFHDCGHDLRLSVPAILRFFEEIALLQSDSLGVGFDYYHEHQVGWLLSRWDLTFGRPPTFSESIVVRTQPRECGRLAANRAFEITAADGSIVVEGMSQWIFVDIRKMRPARIPTDLAAVYGMVPQRGQPPISGEIEMPDGGDPGIDIEVRRGDIDLNGHVNNIRYVEWALETLPEEFLAEHRVRRLKAHFKSQTTLGAHVRAAAGIGDDLAVAHSITEGDRIACLAATSWETRQASD